MAYEDKLGIYSPVVDQEKKDKEIQKMVQSAVEKAPTEILKSQVKQIDTDRDKEKQKLCEMTRVLTHEGLDQFEKVKMEYEEFVSDLHRSLVALGKASKE